METEQALKEDPKSGPIGLDLLKVVASGWICPPWASTVVMRYVTQGKDLTVACVKEGPFWWGNGCLELLFLSKVIRITLSK